MTNHQDDTAPEPAGEWVEDREPAPQRRMASRWWGIVVLAIAGFAILAVSSTRPKTVTGSAVPGPLRPILFAGDCLVWDVVPGSGARVDGSVRRISCDQPHLGEVTDAWPIDSHPPSSSLESGCLGSPTESTFVGFYGDDPSWGGLYMSLAPTIVTTGDATGSYLACVRVAGTDRGDPVTIQGGSGTPELRRVTRCVDDDERTVPCHQPHIIEQLATAAVLERSGTALNIDRDSLQAGCRDFAASQIGGTAANVGAAAMVVPMPGMNEPSGGGRVSILDQKTEVLTYRAMVCQIQAPAGRELTASLVGWGDAPLPLK